MKIILAQTEFANILGVSFENINMNENRKRKPKIHIKRFIIKLMKDYGVTVE